MSRFVLDASVAAAWLLDDGLSLYGAVYLELAQRSDGPLATLDKALTRAAGAAGIALTDPWRILGNRRGSELASPTGFEPVSQP